MSRGGRDEAIHGHDDAVHGRGRLAGVRRRRPRRAGAVTLLAAIALLLTACQPAWTYFRWDGGNSGAVTASSSLTAASLSTKTVRWTATVGPASPSYNSPVLANGRVYTVSPTTLAVYDADGVAGCGGSPVTCAPMWTAALGSASSMTWAPTLANGRVYVTSSDGSSGTTGTLRVFDAAGKAGCSGTPVVCTPLWTATNASLTPAIVSSGFVIVPDRITKTVQAFDAAGVDGCTGSPLVCSPVWTTPAITPGFMGVAVSGGRVYANSAQTGAGGLSVFDAAGVAGCGTGVGRVCQPLWTTPANGVVKVSPTVGDGKVFVVAGVSGTVFAYDAAGVDGCSGSPLVCQPLWSTPLTIGGSTDSGVPDIAAVVEHRLLVQLTNHRVVVALRTDGAGCTGGSTPTCPHDFVTDHLILDLTGVNGLLLGFNGPSAISAYDAHAVDGCDVTRVCSAIGSLVLPTFTSVGGYVVGGDTFYVTGYDAGGNLVLAAIR